MSSRIEKRCWAASVTLEGKVPALALRKPGGKLVGGRGEPSTGVLEDGEASFEGEPLEAIALKAGGLYLPWSLSSACNSLALSDRKGRNDVGTLRL